MVLIFCDKTSPRLQYIFKWIFSLWGINYTSTTCIEDFIKYEGAKILYSSQSIACEALRVEPEGFLQEDTLVEKEVILSEIGGLPVIFKNKGDIGFDIFSAVFFLISRYEEYLPYIPDVHGRFPASASFAYKNRFLEIPVVDLWTNLFKSALHVRFPELVFQKESFHSILTYDVDVAYKFSGRSMLHTMLAGTQDILRLQWKKTWQRFRVLTGGLDEPWDVYEYLQNSISASGLESIFFILSGEHTEFDKNLSPENPAMTALLQKLGKFSTFGLHPSYYSSIQEEKIFIEKARLERVLHKKITASRQHFLKFKFPSTFETLLKAGILKDFSIAFADAPGFRAGTSKPFYFYDLKNEKETELTLFPACWMDSTFVHYLKTDAEEALKKAKSLLRILKEVNGVFIPVFHNNYLSEEGWKQAHEAIIKSILKP